MSVSLVLPSLTITVPSLADRLGRKKAIMIDCTVLIIGIVIQATSFTAWVRFVRFLAQAVSLH